MSASINYKQIAYFPGLHALRFVAAYLVLLHHAEQIRMKHDLPHLKQESLFNNGELAVTFFFVLSGFLITYLLLKEIHQTGTVAVGKFYMRRVLRIWPLYFLLVLIGTVAVPLGLQLIGHPYQMPYQFGEVIAYFVLFAPFMVNLLFGHHLLEPLWSIGVEELFYLGWAPLAKFFRKHLLFMILGVLLLKISINIAVRLWEVPELLRMIVHTLQFEAMCIGALGGYWIFHRKREIESVWIFSKFAQWTFLLFLAMRVCFHQELVGNLPIWKWLFAMPIIPHLLLMAVFCWLILNLSVNSRRIFSLENRYWRYLGDISYGVYMYHLLVVFSLILLFGKPLATLGHFWGTLAFYVLATAGVLLVADTSKRHFEDHFMRLKGKMG